MADWLVEALDGVKVKNLEDWPVEVASAIRKKVKGFSPKTHQGISDYDCGYNRALADYDKSLGIE